METKNFFSFGIRCPKCNEPMDIDRWAMFIEFNPNNPLEIKSYGIHFYGICLNCLEKSKDVIEAITVQKDFNIDELGEFIRSQASNVLSQLAGFYQTTTTKN